MQKTLFEEIEPIGLSIDQAAEEVNVSAATIRNWIKTGYLDEVRKGVVEEESLNRFMQEVAGKEKLTLRANKLKKDDHDHVALSEALQNGLQHKVWREVSNRYESSLSNSFRNKEGIYYTPCTIVDDMLSTATIGEDTTFLDPCCGSGNFILGAIEKGVRPENVFGFDMDPNAVEITKKRILEATGFNAENNIFLADFLEEAQPFSRQRKFDLIFTNPPWGKKLKKQDKERLAGLYHAGKSLDTTSLFYFSSMQLLSDKGQLGFLVQEAFFNISSFQDARRDVLAHRLLRLTDHGKPFKGLLTKACAFVLEKDLPKSDGISCTGASFEHHRQQDHFIKNPKHVLNFWANEEAAAVVAHVYGLPHEKLAGRAKWALGIVTGNNARYCKKTPQAGHVPVYRGADIAPGELKKATLFIPNDFSRYQQVAPLAFYNAPEKLIYRFISSKLVFFCDTEQRYILNSANLMIPDGSFGITNEQLAELLSSDFMNWLFSVMFRTHKILRGDLEGLPIHTGYFEHHAHFDEDAFISYLGLTRQNDGTYSVEG